MAWEIWMINIIFILFPITKYTKINDFISPSQLDSKGLAQAKIIKKSVILFWVLNMTI